MSYPRTQQERIRIIERYYSDTTDTTTCDNDIAAENFGDNYFDEEADEDDCDD